MNVLHVNCKRLLNLLHLIEKSLDTQYIGVFRGIVLRRWQSKSLVKILLVNFAG